MNAPIESTVVIPREFQEISSNTCRSLRRELTDGTNTSLLVKEVSGDKYFVVITQKKSSSEQTTDSASIGGGGIIIEVKRQSIIGSNIAGQQQIGTGGHFEVKPIFGAFTDEHLAACRFITEKALEHTNKTLIIWFGLLEITKLNLQILASDLEEIIKQLVVQQQQ